MERNRASTSRETTGLTHDILALKESQNSPSPATREPPENLSRVFITLEQSSGYCRDGWTHRRLLHRSVSLCLSPLARSCSKLVLCNHVNFTPEFKSSWRGQAGASKVPSDLAHVLQSKLAGGPSKSGGLAGNGRVCCPQRLLAPSPPLRMFATLLRLGEFSQPFKRAEFGLFGGKTKQYGNNVPFSKHKTRRTWLPNVQRKRLPSEILGEKLRVKVTTRALRTIKKVCLSRLGLLSTRAERVVCSMAE